MYYATSHHEDFRRPKNFEMIEISKTMNFVAAKAGVRLGMDHPRGMPSAVYRTLKQVGWSLKEPAVISDHRGAELGLNYGTKTRLRWYMRDALSAQLEKAVVESLVGQDLGTDHEKALLSNFGLDLVTMRRAVHSKRIDWLSRLSLVRCMAGALPTAHRLNKIGYQIRPWCVLCGNGRDTPYHRAWRCPKRPKEKDFLDNDDLRSLGAAGSGSGHAPAVQELPSGGDQDGLVSSWDGSG